MTCLAGHAPQALHWDQHQALPSCATDWRLPQPLPLSLVLSKASLLGPLAAGVQ